MNVVKDAQVEITDQVIKDHGFTSEEYDKLLQIMGRDPNLVELGIFSVMWSEHCSYKSTRLHLKELHTEEDWVICGPGENAGVIDIGDNQAAIFKMESHNHPSFIEPYQGAATGVGGILRDIFTMGARPVANLNALRFGEIDHPKTKHLVSGVVAGIGGYGNCIGVPTIGGECNFHKSYNSNILVNAFNIGIADQDKIFYSAASDIGSPIVYVGSKTGRDGIHGATMASAEFDDDSDEKRPTVQVGDPFTEKLLLEACLELMATDAILAIQDMGAAGLTCSSLEMASKGGTGIELNLQDIPTREQNMTPYEIMLSESQERMLMVIKPEKEKLARDIFEKWDLDFAIIGKITDTGKMVLRLHGEVVADLPVQPLSDEAPIYDRPYEIVVNDKEITNIANKDANESLKKLLSSPDLASKEWIWQQYDQQVMNDTLVGPGYGAAMVRVHGTKKALSLSSDCNARYCKENPVEGGKQAVAESWRNVISTGAKPLAITNCLNFGNPERKEIMGQLVGCLQGMTEACKYLQYPVISGNVSLYNETNGEGILPTPTIGGVGLINDYNKSIKSYFEEDEEVYVIGKTLGHMGSSIYLKEIEGIEDGAPPKVTLELEKKNGLAILELNSKNLLSSCSDVSDGGIFVTIANMSMRNNVGVDLRFKTALDENIYLYAEDQARYIVSVKKSKKDEFESELKSLNIDYDYLGETIVGQIINKNSLDVSELVDINKSLFNSYFDE